MRSVVVTGLGFITPIGNDRPAVLDSLLALRHGLSAWEPAPDSACPVKLAGLIRGFDVSSTNPSLWTWPAGYDFDPAVVRALAPHGVHALAAVEQALRQAHVAKDTLSDGRTGLFCASAGSPRLMRHHLDSLEKSGWRRSHPLGVLGSISGTLNFNLSAWLGIRGACCGFSSACASGSHALGAAFDEIALGRQDRMIVVAAEDLNAESLLPFAGMGALSTEAEPPLASRPFDAGRNGFVGCGGAIAVILEAEGTGKTDPLARLLGWAQAADGHHPAQSHPQGAGLRAAMSDALKAAGIAPPDVDFIHAHGTSTPAGDRAEALAIDAVFSGAEPAVSSTKALTGHGLSMAGLLGAAVSVLSLREQFIPGQAHLVEPLPEGKNLRFPRESIAATVRHVLNNASGFGGANVCHVFTRA